MLKKRGSGSKFGDTTFGIAVCSFLGPSNRINCWESTMSFKQQKNISQSTAKIRPLHPTSWRVPSRGHYITNPNTPLFSGEILQTYPYFRIVSSPPTKKKWRIYPFTDVAGPSHPFKSIHPPSPCRCPGASQCTEMMSAPALAKSSTRCSGSTIIKWQSSTASGWAFLRGQGKPQEGKPFRPEEW